MPHVVVKLTTGRTEGQKQALASAVTAAVTTALGIETKLVSVALEEILPEDWKAAVYDTEILPQMDRLYLKPGYEP